MRTMLPVRRAARAAAAFATSTLALATLAAQDDVLHYDFRAGQGTTARNFASGPKAGPATGTIVTANKIQWEPGRFDSALAGAEVWDEKTNPKPHNYVDTGFTAELKGSITLSWFMKLRVVPPGNQAHYLFGRGELRGFLLGRALKGFALAGWGGEEYLDTTTEVLPRAMSSWVHVALVLDDVAHTATYYVDGEPEKPIGLAKPVVFAADANGLRIGAHDRLETSSYWTIDEFRLISGALTALEIRGLLAAGHPFGNGCGATLTTFGSGKPILGTKDYTLRVTGTGKSAVLLSIGVSSRALGAIPLPLELEPIFGDRFKGCAWQSSMDLVVVALLNQFGYYDFAFPLPSDTGLIGLSLFNQAMVVTPVANELPRVDTTNGYLFTLWPKTP